MPFSSPLPLEQAYKKKQRQFYIIMYISYIRMKDKLNDRNCFLNEMKSTLACWYLDHHLRLPVLNVLDDCRHVGDLVEEVKFSLVEVFGWT